jgi:glycosyltransferase involved in cell wall biosynthesis
MIREMLLGADGLIAVSKSLADLASEVAGKELGVRVIPNGIDGEVFKHTADRRAAHLELGWSEDARYLVSVGHLQEIKGFHHLVGLLPSIRQRAGDVRLVLVGGPVGERGYEARLRSQIAASSLERVVTLTGRVEPKRIATMLNAADLFVLASRSEGWCNAIAEALACGCPVVATEVGGNEELMSHWGLGRLVPFGQWETFANRIRACLEEDWDRAKIAEFGGRRSWQQVAAECVDVFQRVLHRA